MRWRLSGSSTVARSSALVADEFDDDGSPAEIVVDDPATGDAIALSCEGTIDVAGESRPIEDEGAEACGAGRDRAHRARECLGRISVLTSAENDALERAATRQRWADRATDPATVEA